ncbi:MAG: hypothetical protein ACLRX8_07505 [Alistipes sp.]
MAAWLLSSAIFGIVHVHPTVVVNAFVMGCWLHLPAHRFALSAIATPCNQQRHSLPGADCRTR